MIYLSQFKFATKDQEDTFRFAIKRRCYDTWYPFGIMTKHDFRQIDFDTVTVLYGGNGSGKSTVLNVIAEKLGLKRDSLYNRSNFYEDYLSYCTFDTARVIPDGSRIITSDDVFDFMINLRCINNGVDRRREEMFDEYLNYKYEKFQMNSLDDYETLKKVNMARSGTQSKYVRKNLNGNIREHSNGESALLYFQEQIKENALYLLDEPENSLSPEKQLELLKFIEDSARFFGCQFVMATHSPFLLACKGAKIYNLDEEPVCVDKWTDLESVRIFFNFFKDHEKEFERMKL